MNEFKQAILDDRGIIRVTGPDARKLLQGLITNDIDDLIQSHGVFAGLLTPQGKILFDFLLHQNGDDILLDMDKAQCAACLKRLAMYRLRSDVALADASDQIAVVAGWNRTQPDLNALGAPTLKDPRHDALGLRSYFNTKDHADLIKQTLPASDYHHHRIQLGIPEGGKDYAFSSAFPHEALFDELNGVSFSKGCFVGQEVVSRMEHRGATRKRIVSVRGEATLPQAGTDIVAGDIALGTLGSTSGQDGLALIRLDRLADVKAKDLMIKADDIPLSVSKQSWARFEMA